MNSFQMLLVGGYTALVASLYGVALRFSALSSPRLIGWLLAASCVAASGFLRLIAGDHYYPFERFMEMAMASALPSATLHYLAYRIGTSLATRS